MAETELEKMRKGKPYKLDDPEILRAKEAAIMWTSEYRQGNELDIPAQLLRLKMHLGALGVEPVVGRGFTCENGKNIFIGHHWTCGNDLTILDAAKVTIGDYCMIGPNVLITTIDHPESPRQRRSRTTFAKPVTIGDDVWLGAGVMVLPGVKIGNNVIVKPGAVVDKDVADNAVVAGNPAKQIGEVVDDVLTRKEEEAAKEKAAKLAKVETTAELAERMIRQHQQEEAAARAKAEAEKQAKAAAKIQAKEKPAAKGRAKAVKGKKRVKA